MSNVVTLTHEASGSVAQVNLFGATVTSFVAQGEEHLFLSPLAKLDGSKAIRGGIPLVFPIFGPSKGDSTMPQHGFARCNYWKHVETKSVGDLATVGVFELLYSRDVTAGCGENNPWHKETATQDGTDVKLTYEVRVEAAELTTTLTIENVGSSSFDFQALQHTYLQVQDSSVVQIQGLGGYAITDKVSGDSGHVQSYEEPVTIAGKEVDAVYVHPDDHPTLHATVAPTRVRVEAAGQVNDQVAPVSCVVWNPAAEKAAAMSDFANDGYKTMVCVEPGLLGHQALLKPGNKASLSQSLLIHHD
uniref:glucose-6-phosphate 1-epimerase n=1 Tax=Entomoneis paludosa TaxID=265537 RepID=A0A7S3DQB3_9STRA